MTVPKVTILDACRDEALFALLLPLPLHPDRDTRTRRWLSAFVHNDDP
jgi:hypothetical protein